MGDVEVVVGNLADDHGRAHAAQADVFGRRLVDLLVGQPDTDAEAVLQDRQRAVHFVRPGHVFVARASEELAHDVRRHLGGDLAAGVPSHTVCHEEELLLLDEAEVVLVVVTLESLIRLGCVADSHGKPPQLTVGGTSLSTFINDYQLLAVDWGGRAR